MFLPILDCLADEGLFCSTLCAYLLRHIEGDRDQHGPLAERLLVRIYGDDPVLRAEAEEAAVEALEARVRLWTPSLQSAAERVSPSRRSRSTLPGTGIP
jgi:hypothetical protein